MSAQEQPPAPRNMSGEIRRDRPLAIIGILAGLLSLIPLVALVAGPSLRTGNPIGTYELNVALYNFYLAGTVLFSGLAILLIGGVYRILRSRGPGLAIGAVLVAAAGFLTTAISSVVTIGMLDAISNSSIAPSFPDELFQATLWVDAGTTLLILGAFLAGLGLFLLGYLGWRSSVLPDWMALILSVGGAAGFLGFVNVGFVSGVLLAVTAFGLALGYLTLVPSGVGRAVRRPSGADAPASSKDAAGMSSRPEELQARAKLVLTNLRSSSASNESAEKAITHLQQALVLLQEDHIEEAEGHIRLAESYVGSARA